MTPTVVVIDSLALMLPDDTLSTEEIQGSMTATATAKVNSQFFKKAVQIMQQANIILIFVNHITCNVSIGVTPPSAVVNYLKQDEAISGGKAALYVTDTLVKITASSKLEEDKTYGIKGFEAKVEICKSRHAPAGRSVTMIYDQVNGFRNDLSMLDYIKSNNVLRGNGNGYYFPELPEHKFKMSTFADKIATDPELRKCFYETAERLFTSSIRESRNIQAIETTTEETTAPEEASSVVAE